MDIIAALLMLAGAAASPAATTSAPACVLEASQPARPRGSPATWLPVSDYPPWETIRGIEGTVKFSLSVGRNGRPIACKVTQSSGDGRLDAHTCQTMMRRARFCPATDAWSEPIEGEWNGSLRWMVPDDPPEPTAAD